MSLCLHHEPVSASCPAEVKEQSVRAAQRIRRCCPVATALQIVKKDLTACEGLFLCLLTAANVWIYYPGNDLRPS